MKIENVNQIHGALRAKGWTARSWAIAHCYNPRTVLHCIHRFAPTKGKVPQRNLAKEIMVKLSQTLDLTGGCNE